MRVYQTIGFGELLEDGIQFQSFSLPFCRLTFQYKWKKIRFHISPRDEKPEFLTTSGPQSRCPSTSSAVVPELGRTSSLPKPLDTDGSVRRPGPFSSYRGQSPGSDQRVVEELGLSVVHKPSSPALLDMIFVHGLGGASRRSWSKHQDPGLFWPQQWLPLEPDICDARIMTYGYNASFRSGGPQNTNLADFAKGLLFEMRYGKDASGVDLKIGQVRTLLHP